MSIYQRFLTLWSSEFSRAIIFSSAPRKSSCWNAGSNFFSRFKEKKMLLFSFHFWRTVSLGWQVFLLLLPPPTLSIWRMSLVYVQLDKNSVVTPVSVSVIFPLCHWFVAIWLCSASVFFVLSLLASKWVAAYIDVCNQIWTFDEISWIYIKFREISYGFYCFPWHPFLSAHLGLSLRECPATWTLLTSHWNRALFFFPHSSFFVTVIPFAMKKYQNLPQSRSSKQYIINYSCHGIQCCCRISSSWIPDVSCNHRFP